MFNHFSPSPRSNLPLFSLGNWPVHVVTLLIGVHSLAMIVAALLFSVGHASWVYLLSYNSTAVWQGQILRLFTYAFVNPPSIWFVLEMMMLYYFGREVERMLGSKKFALLYVGLVLLGSTLLQLLSLNGMPKEMTGAQAVNFAIFAAFVAIYPGLPFLFGVTARWMLLAFLTLSTLQFLEAHQFTSMVIFLGESVGAILFVIAQGYWDLLPQRSTSLSLLSAFLQRITSLFRMKKLNAPTPSTSQGSSPSSFSQVTSCSTTTSFIPIFTNQSTPKKAATSPLVPVINIDPVLEKISLTGMESLTAQEKEQLEKASSALVARDRSTK